MQMKFPGDHRICFVGDSFTQGTSDPSCLGWVGRISTKARSTGYDVTAYNLGIRRDTSSDILARWEMECAARFRVDCIRYVVFSFGANDMTEEQGATRVSYNKSVENFSKIISAAREKYKLLVVSSPPVGDTAQDNRILNLSSAYQNIAEKFNLPYIYITEKLMNNEIWKRSVADSDGVHPGAEGYGLIARLVEESKYWWFK